mgnify:CR=1 FL=1
MDWYLLLGLGIMFLGLATIFCVGVTVGMAVEEWRGEREDVGKWKKHAPWAS